MGELVASRRATRHHALAEDLLPRELLDARDPCPDPFERSGGASAAGLGGRAAVGSKLDAFLGIGDYTAEGRRAAFAHLLARGRNPAGPGGGAPIRSTIWRRTNPLMQRIVEGERVSGTHRADRPAG